MCGLVILMPSLPSYLPPSFPPSLPPSHSPLHLLGVLVLTSLGLHLLNLNRVWLATAHVELVVAHAQGKDALVDAKSGGKENKVLTGGRGGRREIIS